MQVMSHAREQEKSQATQLYAYPGMIENCAKTFCGQRLTLSANVQACENIKLSIRLGSAALP